ncbi:MAG: deoxyribodipyrimidine photo-lyase [Candidatus Thorarchaeota archaeon]|nr:deoxyribodipyrimidine photo-lyase [Candidatus Thorarchaeota archaeon]
MIEPERIKLLNDKAVQSGKYVLYWMQASQRTSYNHALGYAIHQANRYNLPLLVYFGLTEYPLANERSYSFMLQGLQDVKRSLIEMGAGFTINIESPDQGMINLAKNASLVVVDCDYQRIQRKWRLNVARSIGCLFVQVESNVVVPIDFVSQKEEYTAGTIRPKIHKHLNQFLKPFKLATIKQHAPENFHEDSPLRNTNKTLEEMSIDRTVSDVEWLEGGYWEAVRHLHEFVREKLDSFSEYRNDPSLDYSSNMSPYLHFGQISPLEIALVILGAASPGEESYLEELIVRRELSMNFAHYNDSYDSFDCLPNWAKTTLYDHKYDHREYSYSRKEFEDYQSHDPYWNSAQKQLVVDGKIHGYMRMYWGKKILEWSKTPEEAYRTAVYLNDRYELDGRDPNGYAGIAWCFGKHDRAWAERPIFGKVRYMNDKGLRRKFDIDAYARKYGF